MNSNLACFVFLTAVLAALSAADGQTFQYSRGWTNGKRNGLGGGNGIYELSLIDKLLANPCQLEKLRYILQGKPLNEKVTLKNVLFLGLVSIVKLCEWQLFKANVSET